MTLIALLILAGVSLSAVFSEKGIFNKAETAGIKYNEAKAREVLETVLLADGQYEKNINPEYNQEEFLNELIIKEIPGSRIEGDVAIIGEWGFELDRTVPKIGRPLGKADKLVFPKINAVVDLANDKKNATINITAKEEKSGINKIEIWLLGEKIEEYTYIPAKAEATENYTATQNGKYTIKAYGDLWTSKTVEVTGIVASVIFEPNGKNEWKKEHSTTVTIQETVDKVVKAKYVWTNSVNTPEDNQFPDIQTFKSGDTITKNEISGTYYLWTMLETQSGEKLKWRSEGFNFDNQGPTITGLATDKYLEDGITINVIAIDNQAGIDRIEIYVDGKIKDSSIYSAVKSSITWNSTITGLDMGEHSITVKAYDSILNDSNREAQGKTAMHTWILPNKFSYTKATAEGGGYNPHQFSSNLYLDNDTKFDVNGYWFSSKSDLMIKYTTSEPVFNKNTGIWESSWSEPIYARSHNQYTTGVSFIILDERWEDYMFQGEFRGSGTICGWKRYHTIPDISDDLRRS